MSSLQRMDECAGDSQRTQETGVCEPTPVHYPRKRREGWPFKFYQQDGRMYQNTVPRQHRPDLIDVEEALL